MVVGYGQFECYMPQRANGPGWWVRIECTVGLGRENEVTDGCEQIVPQMFIVVDTIESHVQCFELLQLGNCGHIVGKEDCVTTTTSWSSHEKMGQVGEVVCTKTKRANNIESV